MYHTSWCKTWFLLPRHRKQVRTHTVPGSRAACTQQCLTPACPPGPWCRRQQFQSQLSWSVPRIHPWTTHSQVSSPCEPLLDCGSSQSHWQFTWRFCGLLLPQEEIYSTRNQVKCRLQRTPWWGLHLCPRQRRGTALQYFCASDF